MWYILYVCVCVLKQESTSSLKSSVLNFKRKNGGCVYTQRITKILHFCIKAMEKYSSFKIVYLLPGDY